MNSWSRTRKRIILFIVFFFVIVLVGVPLYLLFYHKPSCFDAKQNGDETGVDCGGSCQLLCSAESLPLIIKGDPRILTVASSTYEVVAQLENPNQDAQILKAHYIFKIFGTDPNPIKSIEGDTFVPKGSSFAIFVDPFTLASTSAPTHATLEWDNTTLVWQRVAGELPALNIKDKELTNTNTNPRLTATLENDSLEAVSNIDLTALLSDTSGNLFSASRTYVDKLLPGHSTQVIFTWPRPFSTDAAQIDIMTRVLP